MFYLLCKLFLADCRYQYFGEEVFLFFSPQHTINTVVFKNVNTEELQHKSQMIHINIPTQKKKDM